MIAARIELRVAGLLAIARILCAPFGIPVIDLSGGEGSKNVLPKFAVKNGESVFSTLEKLARRIGVILTSDTEGRLVITRPGAGGAASDALEHGENILSATLAVDHSELFSKITVKGQAAHANDSIFDEDSAGPSAEVSSEDEDENDDENKAAPSADAATGINRYRPLIIVAEGPASAALCRQRAQWEVGNREAKSRHLSVVVQGWQQSDGTLWRANQRIAASLPFIRVSAEAGWIVSAVNMTLDDGGSKTTLELVDRFAYVPQPEIPKKKKGKGGGKNLESIA